MLERFGLNFWTRHGTSTNIYSALKSSLVQFGVNYSNVMSDTANVIKCARSGVQKLIKNENSYDVGCICHLAEVCVKAGMKVLPNLVDIIYHFYHSS